MPDSKLRIWPVVLLACLLALSSCYETIEGCLDPTAVNFSLDADRECNGCCTYPRLSVRLVGRWISPDTSFDFRYSSRAFADGGGHPFSISRITYFLQDFALMNSTGQWVETTDSVLVQQRTGNGLYEPAYIQDDYLLINPTGTTPLEVGTLEKNGTFSRFRFQLGLAADADRIFPGSLPNNHPLSFLDTSMYDLALQQYLSNRLELRRDTTSNAEELVLAYGSGRLPVPIVIDVPGGFTLPPGFDLQMTLEVNYAAWFASVQDMAAATEEAIISGIVAGIPNSFRLVEIRIDQR